MSALPPPAVSSHKIGGYTPSNGAFVSLGWTAEASSSPFVDLEQALLELRQALLDGDLRVLLERLYVRPEDYAEVFELRRSLFAAPGSPDLPEPTVLSNQPCLDVPCAGFQCIAWVPRAGSTVSSVGAKQGGPGRLLECAGDRALFLACPPAALGEGLDRLFDGCVSRLEHQGFGLRDVARTWLYVDDLLGTYAELNEVRDRVFTEQGLGCPGGFDDPPASTGIQGFHADGRPCFMEVLAVQSAARDRAFSPVQPKMQCEAWDYGSSFSRGMRIDVAGSGLTTLSGTASIAPSGETAHVGDPEAQIQTTLANLESLLEACGKPPRVPGLWTLYFKNHSTWQAWCEAVEAGRLVPPSGPAVFADVCRDDLLFEAEVTLLT